MKKSNINTNFLENVTKADTELADKTRKMESQKPKPPP